jgi:heat shock protein HslJ
MREGVSLLLCLLTVPASALEPRAALPVVRQGAFSLLGKVWRWTALAGPEALNITHPGRYTLELWEDGRYGVRADCNTGGGAYTIDGKRVSLMPGPMRRAACEPHSLGDRFAALLGHVARFARDGDRLVLQLDKSVGRMVYEAMPPFTDFCRVCEPQWG